MYLLSGLIVIVWVNVVLNRMVVDDVLTTCVVVIVRVKVSSMASVDGMLLLFAV